MASWLNDVVAALEIDRLSLVGHSQGSLVALEFASRFPTKLRSVSFIASGLATPVNATLLDAARDNPDAAISMILSWGFARNWNRNRKSIPEDSILMSNRANALVADLNACDTYQNGKEAAAKTCCPIQVILGGKDRMAPRKAGMELIDHLVEPDVHIVAKSGHMIPLDAPNVCRQLLRDFIFANNPAS
jgi:pimeloyl-ACP methyl ester carboxylesterase